MKNKETDFRIGNLIEYEGRVFEIHIIAKEFPTLNTTEFGIGVIDWNNIKPIKLTEEWLIKFGFRLDSINKWHSAYNDIKRTDKLYVESIYEFDNKGMEIDVILNIDETELRRIGIKNVSGNKPSEMQYVHQFQNLYYALTGDELQTQAGGV